MIEFLSRPIPRAIIAVTFVLVLAAIGYYVVRRVRDEMDEEEPSANEMLAEFRRMHRAGKLSEFEFRRVKQTLGEKLQEEIKDAKRDG